MAGPDDNEKDDLGGLYGPTESDIERFNREDAEYLDQRKRDAKSALWKLLAGAVFIIFVSAMFLNVLSPAFTRTRSVDTGPERIPGTVKQVFDGRTISVEIDGIERTVRYIGVETPLFGDRLYDLVIAANREWLLGQEVLLEADEQDSDREGRLLRYVWLDGGMVNVNLIALGLSKFDDTGENDRYAEFFGNAESSARDEGRGLWAPVEGERSAALQDMTNSAALKPGPA